ncbi:MAG: hypothetical protein ACTHK8_19875 [Ginsengibacter sp.]
MRIPDELLPNIYETSKKVFEKKLTLTEGATILSDTCNMNFGSARIYILDFQYLMEGKKFTRTLNAYSMDFPPTGASVSLVP